MKFSRYGLVAVLSICASLLFVASQTHAASKSNGWVEDNLEYGISTAYDWDSSCRSALRSTNPQVSNATFTRLSGDSYPQALRYYFNTGGGGLQAISYRSQNWMSLKGKGNITTPIVVEEGDSTIDFQANFVMFLCGNLVSPDLTNGCTSGLRSITGSTLANDNQRWVTSGNANDRPPNPVGSRCMFPTRTGNVTQFLEVDVYERNGGSGPWTFRQTISLGNRQELVARDNASRYWAMNPVDFTYNRPGGFTQPTQLRFVMTTKTGAIYENQRLTYYRDGGQRVQINCTQLSCVPWGDVGTRDYTSNLSISVTPKPRVTPTVSISPSSLFIGAEATTSHAIENDSPSRSVSVQGRVGFFRDTNNNGRLDSGEPRNDEAPFDETDTTALFDLGNRSRQATLSNFPDGEVCAFTEITNTSAIATTNIASDCVTIAKLPHAQVSGGDVIVRAAGSVITAPALDTDDGRVGSWAEYGAFAPSTIDLHTGASLLSSAPPPPDDKNALTFANTATPVGNFASDLGDSPDITIDSDWPSPSLSGGTISNVDGLAADRVHDAGSSNITLSGDSSITGARTIATTGRVTITGNLQYDNGPYSSLGALPQLIIRAGEVRIAEGVDRIDAWLIVNGSATSSGLIMTCTENYNSTGAYYDGLNRSRCDNNNEPLIVNGPVQGTSLLLRRTAGGEGDTIQELRRPAEVFNLRSDTYLWAYGEAASEGAIRTEAIKELPPRF